MEIVTLIMIIVVAIFVVFFGKILSHALKFVFYFLLIALVVVFIFGISFGDFIGFLRNLIFLSF